MRTYLSSKVSNYLLCSCALLLMLVMLSGCSGSDGANGLNGTNGAPGINGTNGVPGTNGTPGSPGAAGLNVQVAAVMGTAAVTAADELQGAPANPKYLANLKITGATANTAGLATVTFTVKNKDNVTPVTGLTTASASIFKLAPKGNGLNYNKWVPYIYRPGRTVNAGYRENTSTAGATLTETAPGTYTYTFATNLTTAARPFAVGGTTLVGFDPSLTHRVSVYMGGHSGPTGEADFDFVPAGGAVTQTRNIVETATCKKCHGPEFRGHGGDRVTVEGCVTCHSPDSSMVNSAANGGTTESIEMSVMIHKMHAGRELPSRQGPDKQFYDNPNTVIDETADNSNAYTLGSLSATWRTAAFPAVLANCQACHTQATAGTLANVDNWKTVPSRAACGSCHDDINWTTGVNHAGGALGSDEVCALCHKDTGAGIGKSVTDAHNFAAKDIRNIPEFDTTITVDTPARGYYIKGETPVVTIVLKDHFTGATIDHTTVVQQQTSNKAADIAAQGPYVPAEGCIPKAGSEGTACTVNRNGQFTAANVYVVGPRAEKAVNLTYAARATVRSASSGPWDLSAGGGSIRVKVDSGMPMLYYNNEKVYEGYGADELIKGDITVTLPAAGSAALNALFANPAAATAAEVAAWLNANATFKLRAIAYVDEALAGHANAGKLAIRTRGIAKTDKSGNVIQNYPQRNIQIVSSPATLAFSAPSTTSVWATAGSADSVRQMLIANATNPKVVLSAANIKYTLDPVDDLVAGTYIVHTEFADGGRAPAPANPAEPPYVDYRTPSVGITTFQVKTAAEEKPVAGNCTACHWSDAGVGFVLDFPRHHKIFDDKAVDRCGGCHDYLSGEKPDATTQLSYAGSLSNRVHSVHNGANLNYPTLTVGHEETSAFGRNWRITYPMEINNCESCHPATKTSGTWKTNPNRLACMGCHDSDAATAHIKINTVDPTPLAPWSGDEQESCAACHRSGQ